MAGNDYRKILKDIAESLICNKVAFMCGAGMSRESTIPDFSEITKHLLYNYFSNEISEDEVKYISSKFRPEAIVAWYIENKNNGLTEVSPFFEGFWGG
jgi:NAD-dependent SIR2 family protein deacetylase